MKEIIIFYNRGSSFDRRLQARKQEMETDDKDRQREMEEIEEIRKRLGDNAVEPDEESMVWESGCNYYTPPPLPLGRKLCMFSCAPCVAICVHQCVSFRRKNLSRNQNLNLNQNQLYRRHLNLPLHQ